MEAQKQAKPAKAQKGLSNVRGIKNAFLVILACFVVAVCFYSFFLGDASNFDEAGHPQNIWGTIYMGGVIVPVLQTLFLTVIVLSVERWIAISSAKGSGNISKFVANVKECLAKNDIAKAQELCKKQKGSVAAVVFAALNRYKEMDENTVLSKEQKINYLFPS